MGQWFDIDKGGLAKLIERKGKAFVFCELIQNAWDTQATEVSVEITPKPHSPFTRVTITDNDPNGFSNLAHAFTLFAESEKKGDPTKRGRFNLGEKLVLALCQEAEIVTTKGGVRFDNKGRHTLRSKLAEGSRFEGIMRITRSELDEAMGVIRQLLPPEGVRTTVDGEPLRPRTPAKTISVALATEIADAEGVLRRSTRKTDVRIFKRIEGATESWVYEMGIPVVTIDLPWDIDIGQKIPMAFDRDNITPAYRRTLIAHVLNAMHETAEMKEVSPAAAHEALEDSNIEAASVEAIIVNQYGSKRAVWDPSDPEANHRLTAEGYHLIPGRAFSKTAWDRIRDTGAALPAGKLRPTPKPYSDDPNAPLAELLPRDAWTDNERALAAYTEDLGFKLLGKSITVQFELHRGRDAWAANYGSHTLTFNHGRMKRQITSSPVDHNELILHELAHEFASNHLSSEYYDALTMLGVKLWKLAMKDPEFFRKNGAV